MKIVLNRGPIWTTVKFIGVPYSRIDGCLTAIRHVTSAKPAGYRFIPSYRVGTWDGYIRLYKNGKFPSGLLDVVKEAVESVGMSWEVVIDATGNDNPTNFYVIKPDMFKDITLRGYQIAAAKTLLDHGRGIAKMATNSGKTEVIAAMCKAVPGGILVLTTKLDLMRQTSDRLRLRLDEPVGIVGDGTFVPGRCQVAMIQTLVRMKNLDKLFNGLSMIIFDECHHIPSKTAQHVMMSIPAPRRFGFSGTPLLHDNLSDLVLIGATGPVLVDISNADLIEAGISSMPCVDMYVVESNGGYKGDWGRSYAKWIVDNEARNNIIAREVLAANAQSTLILVDRLEHGRKLQAMIPNSIFAYGSLSTDERKSVLDMLRNASGAIVIATSIFDEGVDVPSVDLLVIAAGGETHVRLLQRIGRGMRYKETGVLRVIDFVDDTNKYLLGHSKSRAELYEREGFVVNLHE